MLRIERDNSGGTVTTYELDSRGIGVRVPKRREDSGAHPAFYPKMENFPIGKAAGE
jgi:hypothetical protein